MEASKQQNNQQRNKMDPSTFFMEQVSAVIDEDARTVSTRMDGESEWKVMSIESFILQSKLRKQACKKIQETDKIQKLATKRGFDEVMKLTMEKKDDKLDYDITFCENMGKLCKLEKVFYTTLAKDMYGLLDKIIEKWQALSMEMIEGMEEAVQKGYLEEGSYIEGSKQMMNSFKLMKDMKEASLRV